LRSLAGVLAAAALVALREVLPLLPADHARAKRFAAAIAAIDGVSVDRVRARSARAACMQRARSVRSAVCAQPVRSTDSSRLGTA
jgi:threonine aldolase